MSLLAQSSFVDPKRYEYTAITESDGIRLAVIQPASRQQAEIHCSLIHTSISSCEYDIIEDFTALSYVWGGATNLKTIWVDGLPMEITVNLHSALFDLRDEKRALKLWADAICINQHDDLEKNVQVAMMGRIYGAAGHTIIHIPSPGFDTEVDFQYPTRQMMKENVPSPLVMDAILSSQWPTRVWVCQELVLSRDPWIHCGRRRWKWSDIIFHALDHTKARDSRSPRRLHPGASLFKNMHKARQNRQGGKTITIYELVTARRGSGASDPRDVIWAHIGLGGDSSSHLLAVNYETLSTVDVYKNFTQCAFTNYLGFDILNHVESRCPIQRRDELPSWSPNWSQAYIPQKASMHWNFPDLSAQRKSMAKYGAYDNSDHHSYFPYTRYLRYNFFEDILPCVGFKTNAVLKVSKTLNEDNPFTDEYIMLGMALGDICTRLVELKDQDDELWLEDISTRFEGDKLYRECVHWWWMMIQDEELLPAHPPHSGDLSHHSPFDKFFDNVYCYGKKFNECLTIQEWLVAQLINCHFRDQNLSRKRIALMANGQPAIVPTAAQVGDFLVQGIESGYGKHHLAFLFHEIPGGWDSGKDTHMKAQLDSHTRSAFASSFEDMFFEGFPLMGLSVVHCNFVGISTKFSEVLPIISKYREEIESTMGKSPQTKEEIQWKIYAIH